ncbi:MAG: hypothetical protein WCH31_01320 [Actinomycetes bacterium]
MSYAVVWRENGGSAHAAGLDLRLNEIHLSGAPTGPDAERTLPYTELREVFFERGAPLVGRAGPRLVFVFDGRRRLEITSLDGVGALHEIATQVEGARGKTAA